ncbi:MAG: hypothetical protein ACI4M9_08385 [Succinivibrio sp.]
MESLTVNGKNFNVVKLLGKGKGGYSYLCRDLNGSSVVVKKIHHEPCDYYKFGNKIESELNDYRTLMDVGIRMPKMLDIDNDQETILKEYIEGPLISDLVREGRDVSEYISQLQDMCQKLYAAKLNIDYFPTNFVVQDNLIFYVDYECNSYMDEWNFENWGIKYWSLTDEFKKCLLEHN